MTPRRVRLAGDLYHPQAPPGVVNVTRPRRWSNPHPIGKPCRRCGAAVHDREEAIALFRRDLDEERLGPPSRRRGADAARRELAGRDLACWCPLGQPCHADTLLEIANNPMHHPGRL
jgi:Domain of unknown function (DUF4326)